MNIFFFIAAVVALLSTLMVVTRSNAVHGLLYFVVSLLAVAFIFFILGAPFAAALEVILYAGAIMVVFLFVVMLVRLDGRDGLKAPSWLEPSAWVGPAFLAVVLGIELTWVVLSGSGSSFSVRNVGPKEVGTSLFGPYLLGVEIVSILFMAGLVGALRLARRIDTDEEVQDLGEGR